MVLNSGLPWVAPIQQGVTLLFEKENSDFSFHLGKT